MKRALTGPSVVADTIAVVCVANFFLLAFGFSCLEDVERVARLVWVEARSSIVVMAVSVGCGTPLSALPPTEVPLFARRTLKDLRPANRRP